MKQEMFGTATIEAALRSLKEYGATIPTGIAALAKEKKTGMIVGKFTQSPYCFDGYCIRETTKEGIKMLKKEYPDADMRLFKYNVLVCTGCKDEHELIKGLGI